MSGLLNEIAALLNPLILILDDYHVIDSKPVEQVLAFLVEHLPPTMHLVITTRVDPPLPLPRLRARGQLTELRAADLRFTSAEAAEFLNQLLVPDFAQQIHGFLAIPPIIAEVWIVGYLLVKGVRGSAQSAPSTSAGRTSGVLGAEIR